MSWRTVLITGIAKLDYKMDYLVIRKASGVQRVHISEIGVLIIESTMVSLTSTLVAELVKAKVKVIFCDEKHNPSSELVPYYGSHDTSAKLRQQIAWGKDSKDEVATAILKEKILKQSQHLAAIGMNTESTMLESYAFEIQRGDTTNREGHAAKVYFNSLFGKDFSREQDISINAALDFGYSLLLSQFNREIVSNGYITQIGIHHDNVFNQFNLASDLMEPFRVLVDRIVVEMEPEEFSSREKRCLLDIYNLQIKIGGLMRYFDGAVRIYCKSVFDALNLGDAGIIKFYDLDV